MWKAIFIGLVLSASVFSLYGTEREQPPTLKLAMEYLQKQNGQHAKIDEKKQAEQVKRKMIEKAILEFLARDN